MSKSMCLVKIYNINKNIKIYIKQITFNNNNIVFEDVNLYKLKNILNFEHKIDVKNKIFVLKGRILQNNYILQNCDIILMFNKNESIFDINQDNIFINKNNKDNKEIEYIKQYSNELKYLKIYPEIIPFIYLIKENPIYLESFLRELKNTKSILYNIIIKNEKLFINLFDISEEIIKKLIVYNLDNNNFEENSSSEDINTTLSSSENNSEDEINDQNSIIIELDENDNDDINEIYSLFPNIDKNDIINYYNIFNSNKENVINFIYENFNI